MSPTETSRAARGYSWPPFEPGNGAAVKHGVKASVTKLDADPRAAELEDELVSRWPWLADPAFAAARIALRRTEQRIERGHAWLDEQGEVDESGKVRDVAKYVVSLERLARDLRSDLGLSPTSASKLGRNLSAALGNKEAHKRALDEGHRLVVAAQARQDDRGDSQQANAGEDA